MTMKYLILVLLLTSCNSYRTTIKSQENKCARHFDRSFGNYVYDFVSLDEVPEYPGGTQAFSSFIVGNLKYPTENEQPDLQGSVHLAMIIDTMGNPKNLEIYNKSVDKYSALDKEVLRSAKLMSKWKPGKCNGKKVPVKVSSRIFIDPQM
jgi:TonB family protein